MKHIVLKIAFLGFCLTAQALAERIEGWTNRSDISEERAFELVTEAIRSELTAKEDGETCTAERFWGLESVERDTDIVIDGYTRAPYMGCSVSRTFDCRVVLRKSRSEWAAVSTDCEPTGLRGE